MKNIHTTGNQRVLQILAMNHLKTKIYFKIMKGISP